MFGRGPSTLAPLVTSVLCLLTFTADAQEVVGFRASVRPDTVFVGQQATYMLTVSVPADVRQRLRRNPVFVPPEARSMLAYELPMSKGDPTREGAEVHVYRRALFPLTPGRYQIPSATLTYALPQSPSFFSREDERSLRSEPVTLVAVEPPASGRPASWNGAVGSWSATSRTDGTVAQVGNPFVLTLRVAGAGNATLLPRPEIEISWANVVTENERVVLDTTPTALGGFKEFAWLVTPRVAGTRLLPALEYVFFSPTSRRYETSRTSPINVRVREGDLVVVPANDEVPVAASVMSLRNALEGARPIALPAASVWMWFALGAPLPWLLITLRRRRPRAKRARSVEDQLAMPPGASSRTLRTLFDMGVRERTGVRAENATGIGALTESLRREGVTQATAAEAESLRDALDVLAYSPAPAPVDHRARVRALLKSIDEQARRRSVSMLLFAVALLGGCSVLPARSSEQALVAFTEGQTAYAGRDFVRARDAFLVAARSAPRDPASWANFGTAAWQAGDSASAVLGWQRALRLDPMARDLRPRLELVRAPQSRGAARVWPVPPLPLALLAFGLWCGAWLMVAHLARSGSGRIRFLLLAPGASLALAALLLETRLRAQDLAVIASATPLRSLPALGADRGSIPLLGEVATIRERRGAWVRIELDAGRTGWYPLERTYSLARD